MGRYRCAIGGCPEKTYRCQAGIKFFSVKSTAEPLRSAWKEKIMKTRPDISSVTQIYDYMICSRHFLNGDKNQVPTLFPNVTEEHVRHYRRRESEGSSNDSRNGSRSRLASSHATPILSIVDDSLITLDTSDSDEVNVLTSNIRSCPSMHEYFL